MKPIQAALAEANILIESGNRYVIIEVNDAGALLKIGVLNSRDEREQIHGAVSYYEYNGKLRSIIHTVL